MSTLRTDEEILTLVRKNFSPPWSSCLIRTVYKDGIDIDYPAHDLKMFLMEWDRKMERELSAAKAELVVHKQENAALRYLYQPELKLTRS